MAQMAACVDVGISTYPLRLGGARAGEQGVEARAERWGLHETVRVTLSDALLVSRSQMTRIDLSPPLESCHPDWLPGYRPRTELGRRLLDLRRAYLAAGGRTMSWDELEAEVQERRGGARDEPRG